MLSPAEIEILVTSLNIALRAVFWCLPFAVATAFMLAWPICR
jgi:ABC-type molybdate transport system permease subunit